MFNWFKELDKEDKMSGKWLNQRPAFIGVGDEIGYTHSWWKNEPVMVYGHIVQVRPDIRVKVTASKTKYVKVGSVEVVRYEQITGYRQRKAKLVVHK